VFNIVTDGGFAIDGKYRSLEQKINIRYSSERR